MHTLPYLNRSLPYVRCSTDASLQEAFVASEVERARWRHAVTLEWASCVWIPVIAAKLDFQGWSSFLPVTTP